MPRKNITTRDIQNPNRILSNLINDYVDGTLDYKRFLYRAVVVEIDHIGGVLEKDPPNPKNSIKARVISDGFDSFTPDEDLQIFWPLFPFDVMPIKQGEHVYVIFEDEMRQVGLWITRIPEPKNVDSPNLTPGSKKYKAKPTDNSTTEDLEQKVNDTSITTKIPVLSSDFVPEDDIPKYTAKTGERAIEGSNNSVVVFGSDKDQKKKAGNFTIVTGRNGEEIDLSNDKSSIHVSMNTDIDNNLNISVGEKSSPSAVVAVKTDEIRLVARNGIKLVVEGGDVYINGSNIHLGADNKGESAVLGDTWKMYFEMFLNTWASVHTHLCAKPGDPSGPPVPVPVPPQPNILSKTVKIKK